MQNLASAVFCEPVHTGMHDAVVLVVGYNNEKRLVRQTRRKLRPTTGRLTYQIRNEQHR